LAYSKVEVPEFGILTRAEFLDEFHYRYRAGQHVIGLGPTGRGKTTMFGQMLDKLFPNPKTKLPAATGGLLTIQLGADKALEHLGKPMDGEWPPKLPTIGMMQMDERPLVRRYQPEARKPEDFKAIRAQAARILYWLFGREDWTIFIPDLQVLTDPGMMGLGKEVDQLLLTLRKKGSGVFMDAQAPRWIPRSSTDQTSHLLIWRNRDESVIKRLKEISGLDLPFIMALLKHIDYHDCLWIDNVADEYYVVRSK
jgi:energy-coupling factor transporter ATP-binding protein EcfA2